MRIGLVQAQWQPGDVNANLRQVEQFAARAAAAGCGVVIFPELSDTGYALSLMQDLAGAWPGVALDAIQTTAKRNRIGMIAGLSERDGDLIYNSIALVNCDGKLNGHYRKTHLFRGPEGSEKDVFSPGNNLMTVSMGNVCWGPSICFDLRFPEVYRHAAQSGAQVLVALAAWPSARVDDWGTLCRARAIENQVFMVGVNQVGESGGVAFGGHSCVIGPDGHYLAEGDAGNSGLLIANLDMTDIDRVRRNLPAMESRRPSLYETF